MEWKDGRREGGHPNPPIFLSSNQESSCLPFFSLLVEIWHETTREL